MLLAQALQIVKNSRAEELRSLTRDELMFIVDGMNAEESQTLLFEKNVKVFGGVNGYVDDFFAKGTIEQMKLLPKSQRVGAIALLTKMSMAERISQGNKERVDAAINLLSSNAYAAAAARKRTRRQRGGNKQVVHCLTQLQRFAPCVETNPLRAYQFFYNLGRIQELVGDTEHPELWWKPIEALVAAKKYDQLSAHVDTLKERLGLEYDEPTLSKGC